MPPFEGSCVLGGVTSLFNEDFPKESLAENTSCSGVQLQFCRNVMNKKKMGGEMWGEALKAL